MAGITRVSDATTEDLLRELRARGFVCMPAGEISLLTESGYMREFYRFAQHTKTYRKAWELTEEKLHTLFLINRYTNYGSIRRALSRRRKKK